jgi:hypothetical protein
VSREWGTPVPLSRNRPGGPGPCGRGETPAAVRVTVTRASKNVHDSRCRPSAAARPRQGRFGQSAALLRRAPSFLALPRPPPHPSQSQSYHPQSPATRPPPPWPGPTGRRLPLPHRSHRQPTPCMSWAAGSGSSPTGWSAAAARARGNAALMPHPAVANAAVAARRPRPLTTGGDQRLAAAGGRLRPARTSWPAGAWPASPRRPPPASPRRKVGAARNLPLRGARVPAAGGGIASAERGPAAAHEVRIAEPETSKSHLSTVACDVFSFKQ